MVTTMAKDTTPLQTTVSLYEAKTHLSELGERAAAGEEIVVTKHGTPTFRIVGIERHSRPLPGTFPISSTPEGRAALEAIDWFAPDEERERLWGTRE